MYESPSFSGWMVHTSPGLLSKCDSNFDNNVGVMRRTARRRAFAITDTDELSVLRYGECGDTLHTYTCYNIGSREAAERGHEIGTAAI